MGEENCVADLDQGGYHSLRKMLQGSVRYTFWARSLTDLETPNGFLILVRVGLLGFAGRRLKVRPQSQVNLLNNCRDRRIGHRLKQSPKCQQGLRLSQSPRERFPRGDQKDDGVRTLITRFVILHSDWSSGSRDWSVALHWSFLHSFSRRVTDLSRRLT